MTTVKILIDVAHATFTEIASSDSWVETSFAPEPDGLDYDRFTTAVCVAGDEPSTVREVCAFMATYYDDGHDDGPEYDAEHAMMAKLSASGYEWRTAA